MPQFILGYHGMPRRYPNYPHEFQVFNVMSTAGASILGIGYLLPAFYLTLSLFYGKKARPNPWSATGLEWQTPEPAAAFTTSTSTCRWWSCGPYEYAIGVDQMGRGLPEPPGPGGRTTRRPTSATTGPPAPCTRRPTLSASTHSPVLKHHFDDLDQQHASERLGMWMFLATEILFFGGLFGAYTVYRLWYPAEFEYASSHLIAAGSPPINTVFLVTSSLTMTLAIRSAKLGDRARAVRNLLLTFGPRYGVHGAEGLRVRPGL